MQSIGEEDRMAAPRRGKNARGFQVRSSVFVSSLSHVLLPTASVNQPPKLSSQKEARTPLGYVRLVGGLYHFQVKICLTEDGWQRRQGKFSVLGHSSSIHSRSPLPVG